MTKEEAQKLIEIYGRAWENKDPDLITSVFTDDASYDDPHEPINNGKGAIRQYWIQIR
jgi:ketosteroid isomerase-like protein